MKRENLFYLIFAATIIIVRFLKFFLLRDVHLVIFGILIHHFFAGILLFAMGIFAENKNMKILICGIGLGLFSDELAFMILGGGGDAEYWKPLSILGAILVSLLVFSFRKQKTELILKI